MTAKRRGKVTRRTKAELEALKVEMYAFAEENAPVSVRQIFYHIVSAGMVEKTENGYRQIGVHLTNMRKDGSLPYEWIVDPSRSIRYPHVFGSARGFVEDLDEEYRRDPWQRYERRLEIWCESESIAGAISETVTEAALRLCPLKGYGSLSFIHDIARDAAADGRPLTVLYLGDHDPSGLDLQRDALARFTDLAPQIDVEAVKLAVTPAQIRALDLPERPPKDGDTRTRGFNGGCVETEAIPPVELRRILREAISDRTDPAIHRREAANEKRDRKRLREMIEKL